MALWELQDAHKELTQEKHNFGGHKEKALHAINGAIKQLDLILKHAGESAPGDADESRPARGT